MSAYQGPDAPSQDADSRGTKAVYGALVGGGVGRSVSWLLAARIVSIVTSLVTAVVLGRLLSPADFGVQAVLSIVLLLAVSLSEGTFAVPLLQRKEIDAQVVASAAWLSVGGGLLCMAVLIAFTPGLAKLLNTPRLGAPMYLTVLVLPLRGLSSVGVALLERNRDYRGISLVSVVGMLSNATVSVIMAFMGFGLWALVIPNLLEMALEAVLNTRRARLPFTTLPTLSGVRGLFRAGSATTANQILSWAGMNAPSLITSHMLGPAMLGLFSRANNLQNNALQITGGPVGRVLVPTFASLQGDRPALRAAFRRFMGVVLPLNALVTAAAVVHAEAAVRLLLGRKWFAAIPLVQLIFLGFLPRSAYKVTEALSLGAGQFGATARRQAVYCVSICSGAAIGAAFGIEALTLGVAGGLWAFYIFSLSQAEKLAGLGWRWLGRAHLQALLLALIVGLPDALVVRALEHLRHPANPGSFKAMVLIVGAHAGGALVGAACLALVLTISPSAFGEQASAAWARLRSEAARALGRLRPLRAPG